MVDENIERLFNLYYNIIGFLWKGEDGVRLLKRKKMKHSLLASVLLLYIITLIPIVALQYYNYAWNAETVNEELSNSARSNISYLRDSLRNSVEAIVSSEEYLLSSPAIPRYLTYYPTMQPADQFVFYVDIMDRLANVCYSHPIIEQLALYYPTINRSFWVDYNIDFDHYAPSRQKYAGEVENFDALMELYFGRDSVLVYDQGCFHVIYGKSIINDSIPHLLLKARLKLDTLQGMIGSFDTYSQQKAFMIHWASGQVVASTDELAMMSDALVNSLAYHNDDELYQLDFAFENQRFSAFCADITSLGVTIVQLVDDELLNAIPNRLLTLLYTMAALAAVLAVVFFLSMHYMVNRPVRDLVQGFESAGQGDLSVQMSDYGSREFLSLSSGFNGMMDRLNELITQNYRQKILLQQAQLRQLHSQIEPHFLYNSFFMLRHTIAADDIDKAEKICDYLGNYFRFITRLEHELLPLEEEFANTMNYIAIQEMRFEPHLTMDIQPPPENLKRLRVPALILQPLIENAIVHGVPKREGRIRLSFHDSENLLCVCVEDNGSIADERIEQLNAMPADENSVSGAHALRNIHNRLRLRYGSACGLRFRRSELGGLCVEMYLQKRHSIPNEKEADTDVSEHSDRG